MDYENRSALDDHQMKSDFARREEGTDGRPHDSRAGAMHHRDRIHTGRVENLRSMGNELMRPSSRDEAAGTTSSISGMRTRTETD